MENRDANSEQEVLDYARNSTYPRRTCTLCWCSVGCFLLAVAWIIVGLQLGAGGQGSIIASLGGTGAILALAGLITTHGRSVAGWLGLVLNAPLALAMYYLSRTIFLG